LINNSWHRSFNKDSYVQEIPITDVKDLSAPMPQNSAFRF